jgi:hypothetical protein
MLTSFAPLSTPTKALSRPKIRSSHKSEEMKRSRESGPVIEPRKIARMKR